MDTPLAWLSDQQLIAMARKAGLCFPDCWHLDEITTSGGLDADQQWIADGEDTAERNRRAEIIEASELAAQQKLKQLRTFALLVISNHQHAALRELIEPL